MTTRYAQVEIENLLKVDSRFIEFSMNEAWISPAFPESKEFDEEDLQRFRLIAELRDRLGVNESGIDVILHLLDQLYVLRSRLVNEPV